MKDLRTPLNLWLMALAVGVILLACTSGSTSLRSAEILEIFLGGGSAGDRLVILSIRLPRALAAFLVGCSLGLSGAALQGLLRNPLADPGVLGVSASASLAATVVIYFNIVTLSPWLLPIAAIAGALVAVVLLSSAAVRSSSVVTLILIGVGLSSFAGALMSLLLNLAPSPFTLGDMINWTLGSVANRSFDDIIFALPFMAVGAALLLISRRGLSALALGEETARAVGVNLSSQRWLVVMGAGLATGAAVSIAGAIGFVGLVTPHLVRPWVAYDPARCLMPAALLAGVLLVLGDILVRWAPTNNELNLGVVAALFGAPLFVWIVATRGARGV